MLTGVFDHGRPSAFNTTHVNSTPHSPSQVYPTTTATQQKSNVYLTNKFFSTLSNLRDLQPSPSGPPIFSTTMTQHRCHSFPKSSTSFLCRWLPPPCQYTCFFIVGPLLSFLGTSIIIPPAILTLEQILLTCVLIHSNQVCQPLLLCVQWFKALSQVPSTMTLTCSTC